MRLIENGKNQREENKMTKENITFEKTRVTDTAVITSQIEHRNGLVFMRSRIRKLRRR